MSGQPALSSRETAGFRARYDEHDRKFEEIGLGLDGQPTMGDDKVCITRTTFNPRGQVITRRFQACNNAPC